MLSAIFIVVLSLLFTFTKRSTVSQSLGALEYYAGRPSSEIVTDKTNSLFGSRSSEYSNYNIFILEYSTAFNQIKVYGRINSARSKSCILIKLMRTALCRISQSVLQS